MKLVRCDSKTYVNLMELGRCTAPSLEKALEVQVPTGDTLNTHHCSSSRFHNRLPPSSYQPSLATKPQQRCHTNSSTYHPSPSPQAKTYPTPASKTHLPPTYPPVQLLPVSPTPFTASQRTTRTQHAALSGPRHDPSVQPTPPSLPFPSLPRERGE
jgi:hypothetical protein